MSAHKRPVPTPRSAFAFVLLAPWLLPTALIAGPHGPAMRAIYGKSNAVGFVSAGVDWHRFANVSLEATRYESIRKRRPGRDPLRVARLLLLVDELMRDSMQGWADAGGAGGTLAVRPVLREVNGSSVPLDILSTAVLWWPVDGGGATFDIELADAETGAYLGVIAARGQPPFWKVPTYFSKHGQARWFLKRGVREAARLLFELRSLHAVPPGAPDAGAGAGDAAEDVGR